MLSRTLPLRAGVVLAYVAGPLAFAQFDQQWVTFANGTAQHLALSPQAVSDASTEVDFDVGDLDKDGFQDLVVVRKQPAVTTGKRTNLLLMNENGRLVDRTADYAATSDVPGDNGFLTATNDRDVVLGDLDGDGWLDVATCIALGYGDPKHLGHPRVYRNLGNDAQGNWLGLKHEDARIPPILKNGNPVGPNACAVAAGDVNHDGAPDLFFADYDDGEPSSVDTGHVLLINDGNGYFTNETTLRLSSGMISSGFGTAAHIVDMNLDGWNDIVRSQNGPVDVYYNNPSNVGRFHIMQNAYSNAAYFVGVGDLNNDGRLDLAVGDDSSDRVQYNLGTDALGRVNWGPPKAYQFLTGGDDGFANQMLLVDLDGDGWRDVVQTDFDVQGGGCSRYTHIYHNPGGTVGSQITLIHERQNASSSAWLGAVGMTYNDLKGTYNAAAFDLDNDGDLDLVLGRCDGTYVWLNQRMAPVCQADIGSGGPGDAVLTACGQALESGRTSFMHLRNVGSNSFAALFAGVTANPTFVFDLGGTLVPFPPALTLFVPTDAEGEVLLPVPGGFGPLALHVQFVAPDGPGYELSNALRLDFLP